MNDDLISRQAAIEFIKDHSYPVRYDNNSIEQGMTVTGIEQALNEVPTVRLEQKTGRWIVDALANNIYRCSECGIDAPVELTGGTEYKSNYCPNCGADMRSKAREYLEYGELITKGIAQGLRGDSDE